MAVLRLNNDLREQLAEIVQAGYPHETCGVIVGRQVEGEAEVVRLTVAKNLNTERAEDRFDMDPGDFQSADDAARKDGLEVIGIWHSHPDHPAEPSQTDLDAAWPGWSYTIVSVSKQGVEDLRSWRLGEKAFFEESIEV